MDNKCMEYSNINRAYIYWVAIPFSEERPLKVFKPLESDIILGTKNDENEDTFTGSLDENGIRHSDVVDIIVRYKRRMAIVVQENKFNYDTNYDFVYVIPLTTFNSNDSKVNYFKKHSENPRFHHIGKIKGKESVANISDIKRIHKSLLFSIANSEPINNDNMTEICKKIGVFMSIDEIDKCKECKYNYEKYINIEKLS